MEEFQNDDFGGPAQPLLKVTKLVKHFKLGLTQKGKVVKAVDDVSFDVKKLETLGIVGESGCGKSTTARLLMQLLKHDKGELIFDGQEVGSSHFSMKNYHQQVQMVFQDSFASLNPRLTIQESIAFGPRAHHISKKAANDFANYLLSEVGLEPSRFAYRYPNALSGGQRQRVNIARALAMKPRLVILDEAVSALDKSVESQVLRLLQKLQKSLNLTYVFISHDLNVVRWISDRTLVMYLGKVVEVGPTESLFNDTLHPYTAALLKSMPSMDPEHKTLEPPLVGDPPSPISPPSGCHFHTRCPFARFYCSEQAPILKEMRKGHQTACFKYQDNPDYELSSALNNEVVHV